MLVFLREKMVIWGGLRDGICREGLGGLLSVRLIWRIEWGYRDLLKQSEGRPIK